MEIPPSEEILLQCHSMLISSYFVSNAVYWAPFGQSMKELGKGHKFTGVMSSSNQHEVGSKTKSKVTRSVLFLCSTQTFCMCSQVLHTLPSFSLSCLHSAKQGFYKQLLNQGPRSIYLVHSSGEDQI